MEEPPYLTAQEAGARLGISPATLYAYVSRGLIRSEAVAGDSRKRRYHGEDVRKLLERKDQRRNPAGAVKAALHWGAPVLESALTLITDDGLYYRGHDALQLATTHTFDEVAALLWTGHFDGADALFRAATPAGGDLGMLAAQDADLDSLQRWMIALTRASAHDLAAYSLQPERGAQAGARILRLLVTSLGAAGAAERPIAALLALQWAADQPQATHLLNAALILSADHELNTSAFVARVVASAAASLYSVVIAGLATLQGFRHGGDILRVAAMLQEIGAPARAAPALASRLRCGERLAGFGHRLYRAGDPRGRMLLALIQQAYPDAPAVHLAGAVCTAAADLVGQQPTIDFALAVLARVLALPPGGALALFALGRSAGWIAHALEQYAQGDLIRPRATYIGAPIAPAG